MSYPSTIVKLYLLMIHADEDVTESELQVGKQILKIEGLEDSIIDSELATFKTWSKGELISSCISSLRQLSTPLRNRAFAWMFIISEIDWVTDKRETSLIDQIYAQFENVSYREIALVESELSKHLVEISRAI